MTRKLMTKHVMLAGVCSMAFLMNGACADSSNNEGQDETQPVAAERPEPMSREERLAMRRKMQEAKDLERADEIAGNQTAGEVTGEVPSDLLNKIYADLEGHSRTSRSEFTLLAAESVQWPDGSLGCPEPGQMYTQALVNGYRIVIGIADQQYDYRASEKGFFKLCPGPGLTR